MCQGGRQQEPDLRPDPAPGEEFPGVDVGAGGGPVRQVGGGQGGPAALQLQPGVALDQLPHQDDGPQGVRAGGVLGA